MVEAMALGQAIAWVRGGEARWPESVMPVAVWRPLGTSDSRADGWRCEVEYVFPMCTYLGTWFGLDHHC